MNFKLFVAIFFAICYLFGCFPINQVASAKPTKTRRKRRKRSERGKNGVGRRKRGKVMASRENIGKREKSPQKEMEEKMRGRENTESQVKTGTFPLKDEDTAMCFQWFLIYPKQYVFISFCKYVFFFFCREKPPVKEARRPPAPPSWLQRDLKVRFIDKAFKGGRYYNSKVLTRLVSLCLLSAGSWNVDGVIK